MAHGLHRIGCDYRSACGQGRALHRRALYLAGEGADRRQTLLDRTHDRASGGEMARRKSSRWRGPRLRPVAHNRRRRRAAGEGRKGSGQQTRCRQRKSGRRHLARTPRATAHSSCAARPAIRRRRRGEEDRAHPRSAREGKDRRRRALRPRIGRMDLQHPRQRCSAYAAAVVLGDFAARRRAAAFCGRPQALERSAR